MLYQLYELTHAAVGPLRFLAQTTQSLLENDYNPIGRTPGGKALAASCEMLERVTRRYGKPCFGLDETRVDGKVVPVVEEIVAVKPFCQLLHFKREPVAIAHRADPKILIVAPLSGHYATLLRGTVAAMLPEHDVYVTDWTDARMVPASKGTFDLESYTAYLIDFLRLLGPGTHTLGVCQPGIPLMMATSLMAEDEDPAAPASMVIMGSPIDTRRSPTLPNRLATEHSIEWFERNVTMPVPWPNPGALRQVYPGFLQISGFMTMNLDRHTTAYHKLYRNLVEGDGDSAESHRRFYDEYLAVLDLTAEFYLQTVKLVFQEQALAKGQMTWRGRRINPGAITKTALMTVEGENDDISGIGQTQAAHDLCVNIPTAKQQDYVQPGVGHYGVFNGNRWRTEIQPRIRDFIRANMTH